MLYAIMFFRAFGVVEALQSTDKISSDPTDTLEAYPLPYELLHHSVTSCHHAPTLPGSQVQGSMSLVASQSLPS